MILLPSFFCFVCGTKKQKLPRRSEYLTAQIWTSERTLCLTSSTSWCPVEFFSLTSSGGCDAELPGTLLSLAFRPGVAKNWTSLESCLSVRRCSSDGQRSFLHELSTCGGSGWAPSVRSSKVQKHPSSVPSENSQLAVPACSEIRGGISKVSPLLASLNIFYLKLWVMSWCSLEFARSKLLF